MNDDLISREWLKDAFDNLCCHDCKKCRNFRIEDSFYKCNLIENAPTVKPTIKPMVEMKFDKEQMQELVDKAKAEVLASIEITQGEWIPIKTRELTEEEKEEYPDCTFMYDCKLPEDGEEVLVTTWNGKVALDTFYRDDGCYFETYCDEEDVVAWRPLPEPYKKEVQND